MPTLHVKRGIEFRPDLYNGNNRSAWLDAVGKEIETKGLSITVGEGAAAKEVKNAADLQAAYKDLQKAASAAGSTLKGYVGDLVNALDDIVKPSSSVAAGDKFDLTSGSDLSKALGLSDGKASNYAAQTTAFGAAARTRPVGTMNVAGAVLQAKEAPPPAVDLTKIPHMSMQTLANSPVTYGRDGEEVEDTRVITGLTKDQAVDVATKALGDLQRSKAGAGLTLGTVPLDEMNWDSDSHALRRTNPYVSFTLDSRSFEVNPNSGMPRVAVGRDFFFDTFLEKIDVNTGKLTHALRDIEAMYRARVRYGSDKNPTEGTRALIGVKQGTYIDADGTKHATKLDSRSDSVTQEMIDTIVDTARTGKLGAAWGTWSANQIATAAASLYRYATAKGITEDIGGETGVLALGAGAVGRQIRGRFHLDESDHSAKVQGFQQGGEPKIKELITLITAAPEWTPRNNQPNKAALLAQANALVDKSAIIKAATDGLKKLDPAMVVDAATLAPLWPDQTPPTELDAEKQRVVTDAIRSCYDAFAENIDQLQRQIGGNSDGAVRDAGNAKDVQGYLRQKAATARFMAFAETASGSGVTAGSAPTYKAYADKLLAMPDGKEKTDLFQRIGIGTSQLRDMGEASFSSAVKIDAALTKKQTLEGFITAFNGAVAGATKDAFVSELGAYLAGKNSPALQGAAAGDKDKVLESLRKNLTTAHVEILHRMVEGAGSFGQAAWFDNYRQKMIGVNAQSWNFLIVSMDYLEGFDAKTGLALKFEDRVKRTPLDPATMTGAMISNDVQIELECEEGYTTAIETAQYALNNALAGMVMDFAVSKNAPGVVAGQAGTFEKYFADQMTQPAAQKKAFVDELTAFCKAKGSPIAIADVLEPLARQEKAIKNLVAFTKAQNPSGVATDDRTAVENWLRQQVNQDEAKSNEFLTALARWEDGRVKGEFVRSKAPQGVDPANADAVAAWFKAQLEGADPVKARAFNTEYRKFADQNGLSYSSKMLKAIDLEPFVAANAGQPTDKHAGLVKHLDVAREIWTMVKDAQRGLSVARGEEVKKVLRDVGYNDVGWDPPTRPKGSYALDWATG